MGFTFSRALYNARTGAGDYAATSGLIEYIAGYGGGANPAAGFLMETYHISQSESEKRLGLQMKVGDLVTQLSDIRGFAGIEVKHEPRYQVEVYFTRLDWHHLHRLHIEPELKPFVKFKRTRFSTKRVERLIEKLSKSLDGLTFSYQGGYDRKSGKIELLVESKSKRRSLKRHIPKRFKKLVKIKVGTLVSRQASSGALPGDWGIGGYAVTRSPNVPIPQPVDCTVGFAVTFPDTGTQGLVSAGHCENNLYLPGNPIPLAHDIFLSNPRVDRFTRFDSSGNILSPDYDVQIWEVEGLELSSLIYFDNKEQIPELPPFGYFDVVGVIRAEQQTPGTIVCKSGAITGVTCSEVVNNFAFYDGLNGWIQTSNTRQSVIGLPGDSGSPVFTYPSGSSNVLLAGVFVGSNDNMNISAGLSTGGRFSESVHTPIDEVIDVTQDKAVPFIR